jgi:hypothetical protein
MTARDRLIAAGILRPGAPPASAGDPTPERSRNAPLLALDALGRRAARSQLAERTPRRVRDDDAERPGAA